MRTHSPTVATYGATKQWNHTRYSTYILLRRTFGIRRGSRVVCGVIVATGTQQTHLQAPTRSYPCTCQGSVLVARALSRRGYRRHAETPSKIFVPEARWVLCRVLRPGRRLAPDLRANRVSRPKGSDGERV